MLFSQSYSQNREFFLNFFSRKIKQIQFFWDHLWNFYLNIHWIRYNETILLLRYKILRITPVFGSFKTNFSLESNQIRIFQGDIRNLQAKLRYIRQKNDQLDSHPETPNTLGLILPGKTEVITVALYGNSSVRDFNFFAAIVCLNGMCTAVIATEVSEVDCSIESVVGCAKTPTRRFNLTWTLIWVERGR